MLTQAEILALPAGPELDGLVDEIVFGIDRRATTSEQIADAIWSLVPLNTPYSNDDCPLCIFGTTYHAQWNARIPTTPNGGGWGGTARIHDAHACAECSTRGTLARSGGGR